MKELRQLTTWVDMPPLRPGPGFLGFIGFEVEVLGFGVWGPGFIGFMGFRDRVQGCGLG